MYDNVGVVVKTIIFHIKVLKEIETVDFTICHQILELLGQLGSGVKLGMPVSRPMPTYFTECMS